MLVREKLPPDVELALGYPPPEVHRPARHGPKGGQRKKPPKGGGRGGGGGGGPEGDTQAAEETDEAEGGED